MPADVQASWCRAVIKDAGAGYITNRDICQYAHYLGGFSVMLGQASGELASNVVLDIGAGRGIAINDLANCPELSAGLECMATGLRRPDNYSEDAVPYYVAGAETLLGIPDESVAAATAVYSTMYSVRPDMVVDALDRVLVPGGIAKFVLGYEGSRPDYPSGADAYKQLFRDHGFNAASLFIASGDYALAAIKPGGNLGMDSIDLLYEDRRARNTIIDAHCQTQHQKLQLVLERLAQHCADAPQTGVLA
jgi:SAM-dependent methyltransferase